MAKTLLGLCASMAVACADPGVELGSTQGGVTFEDFHAMAQGWKEPGTGYYIVDWDTVLRGDRELLAYWGQFQQGALAIYAQGGQDIKWDATQRHNLTYCIGATFGANKQKVVDAMKAATEMGWEKFADVNFTYAPGEDASCTAANPNVVMDVNQIDSGGQYLARSFFPNSARADRNVLVDPNSFDPAKTNNIPLANILGHELGHVLGFRHEHIRADGNGAAICPEDNNYRALTTYDSASVMHYPQCNGTSTTLAFTQRDRDGVALVYGPPVANMAPMSQIMIPSDGATVAPTFGVEASVVDTDLVNAQLVLDDSVYQTLTAPPFTFQVTDAAVGPHILKIVGTDGNGQIGEQTIHVTVARAGGGGGGGGGGEDTSGDISGGCNAGPRSAQSAGLWLGLGLLGLVRRRATR